MQQFKRFLFISTIETKIEDFLTDSLSCLEVFSYSAHAKSHKKAYLVACNE